MIELASHARGPSNKVPFLSTKNCPPVPLRVQVKNESSPSSTVLLGGGGLGEGGGAMVIEFPVTSTLSIRQNSFPALLRQWKMNLVCGLLPKGPGSGVLMMVCGLFGAYVFLFSAWEVLENGFPVLTPTQPELTFHPLMRLAVSNP